MALNSRDIVFVSLAVVVTALFLNANASPVVGGWRPIEDLDAPEVVEVGKFAIEANNIGSNNANLEFEKIASGETQVVAGTNYKLVIVAKDGNIENQYEAIVWVKLGNKGKSLTSFKQL